MTVLTFVLQRQGELKPMELSQNELKLVACIPVSSPHCHHVPDATQAGAALAVGTQRGHRRDTEGTQSILPRVQQPHSAFPPSQEEAAVGTGAPRNGQQ